MSKTYVEIGQEVEAVQFTGVEAGVHIIEWTGDVDVRMLSEAKDDETIRVLFLNTPGGTVTIEESDWVVQLAPGIFGRMTDEHFTNTYKKKDS